MKMKKITVILTEKVKFPYPFTTNKLWKQFVNFTGKSKKLFFVFCFIFIFSYSYLLFVHFFLFLSLNFLFIIYSSHYYLLFIIYFIRLVPPCPVPPPNDGILGYIYPLAGVVVIGPYLEEISTGNNRGILGE
jgi:hypothetical protein